MENTESATATATENKNEIQVLLREHPGGFSVAANGTITGDREAIAITSIEQFSQLVREPRTVAFDLSGGRVIQFKVRPLDVKEQRTVDELDSEAPMPPIKPQKTRAPSLAQGRPTTSQATEDYDWQDKDFRRKQARWRELKRAALISIGLMDVKIPGDTLEARADFLAANFTVRILDGIEASISELSTAPIERAVFS